MDDNVMAAMARWPDVPKAYGWLSLSETGRWRLHPDADAWRPGVPCSLPYTPGQSIESVQIRNFIDRNYTHDAQGRWFFQNGPQRVYVRLDAAPYILLTGSTPRHLATHNGLAVERVTAWWLDDHGRLYAQTEHGPGLVAGRDAPAVVDALHTRGGEPLTSALESLGLPDDDPKNAMAMASPVAHVQLGPPETNKASDPVPLYFCAARDMAERLGFIPCPQA